MTTTEKAVAAHYTTGALTERVGQALKAMGVNPDAATAEDLKAADEFHTGGVQATEHFFGHLDVSADTRVIDMGSGIGGTARFVAGRYGAQVTGVDLTPEFVETAGALSEMVGLGGKTAFHVGSALAMPVPDASFDLATLMHVGMNIEDKDALLAEAARVLVPGGTFAVFDVMKGDVDEPLVFPLPWSTVPETSFVVPPEAYVSAAKSAGLDLVLEHDRTVFAKDFMAAAFAAAEENGPSPMGIHLMMGETAFQKLQNYVENLHAGRIRPTEMVFRKP